MTIKQETRTIVEEDEELRPKPDKREGNRRDRRNARLTLAGYQTTTKEDTADDS